MERCVLPASLKQPGLHKRAYSYSRGSNLAVWRFRRALSFTDQGHVVQCLASTLQAQDANTQENDRCSQAVQECAQNKNIKDRKCKDGKKLMKTQSKVLKGIQAEKKRFMKLIDQMQQQGTSADDIMLAVQQFNQLECTLQTLCGNGTTKMDTVCMDSSSSSSSSDSDCDTMTMLKTARHQPMQVDATQQSVHKPVNNVVSMPRTVGAMDMTPGQQLVSQALQQVAANDVLESEVLDNIPELVGLPSTPFTPYDTAGRVLVCQGKKCAAAGARAILSQASRLASDSGVEVLPCKCLGKCKLAPAMRLKIGAGPSVLYTNVSVAHVHDLMHSTFVADVNTMQERTDEQQDERQADATVRECQPACT